MTAPEPALVALPMGESLAFCLRLRDGCAAEYRRRHDALWPDMRDALAAAGVLHYEIFLEPTSLLLFAFMVRRKDHTMDQLPQLAVWQRWQSYMADLLIQEEGRPARLALDPMFRMPCSTTQTFMLPLQQPAT